MHNVNIGPKSEYIEDTNVLKTPCYDVVLFKLYANIILFMKNEREHVCPKSHVANACIKKILRS